MQVQVTVMIHRMVDRKEGGGGNMIICFIELVCGQRHRSEVAKLPRDCPTKNSNNHTHTKYQAHPLTKDGIYRSCTIWASNIHYVTHF